MTSIVEYIGLISLLSMFKISAFLPEEHAAIFGTGMWLILVSVLGQFIFLRFIAQFVIGLFT